jgi:hypothetical protein
MNGGRPRGRISPATGFGGKLAAVDCAKPPRARHRPPRYRLTPSCQLSALLWITRHQSDWARCCSTIFLATVTFRVRREAC